MAARLTHVVLDGVLFGLLFLVVVACCLIA